MLVLFSQLKFQKIKLIMVDQNSDDNEPNLLEQMLFTERQDSSDDEPLLMQDNDP